MGDDIVNPPPGDVIKKLVFISAFLAFALVAEASEQRPNILMIIVDDLAPVGERFGGPVQLPSLDALANRGVSFTNNYANVPVCGASRASMMSGLAPTSTRFLTFDSRLDEDAPDVPSLPAYFKSNGWHTVAHGKVFDVIADSQGSWSEPVWSPPPQWHGKKPDHRGEHLQAAYLEPFSSARFPFAERLKVDDDAYPDGQVAARAVIDIERLAAAGEPFFLAVGFRKPHLPFNAPDRYWRDARQDEPLPVTWTDSGTNVPLDLAGHRSPELRGQYDALPLFGDPDTKRAAEIVLAYHAAARFADAQVGRVLTALQASDAADNTIVVLLGDHGFLLGHYRMWTKHALFEPALRTPLIIADPRRQGGAMTTAVTDLLDVYPTLVDLAGLPGPGHLDGESLMPLIDNPELQVRANRPVSVSRWQNGESVRDERYRYTRWFDEDGVTLGEMLFDLSVDGDETNNLVADTAFASTVTRLQGELSQNREGPGWSEALDASVGQWQLLASPAGAIILAAVVYPLYAGLVVLSLLLVIGLLVWRKLRVTSD